MIKVAFDVDGCLIWAEGMDGEPDTPRYEVIQLLHLLRSFGCKIFIWSGGGMDYACRWVDRLGLDDITVEAKGGFEPDIAIDDEEVKLGKVNIKV